MTPDPIAVDRRQATRRRKVGEGVVCVVCGIADPRVIHLHHPITGEVDSDAIGPRCLNDHRLADLAREGAGLSAKNLPPTLPERAIAADRALAAELDLLGAGLRERAAWAERLLLALDGAGVPWRDLPGVQP